MIECVCVVEIGCCKNCTCVPLIHYVYEILLSLLARLDDEPLSVSLSRTRIFVSPSLPLKISFSLRRWLFSHLNPSNNNTNINIEENLGNLCFFLYFVYQPRRFDIRLNSFIKISTSSRSLICFRRVYALVYQVPIVASFVLLSTVYTF